MLFAATGSDIVVQSSTGVTSTWFLENPTPEVKVRNLCCDIISHGLIFSA